MQLHMSSEFLRAWCHILTVTGTANFYVQNLNRIRHEDISFYAVVCNVSKLGNYSQTLNGTVYIYNHVQPFFWMCSCFSV